MAIASIKEWLNHKDYDLGLELYCTLSDNTVVKKLLSLGPTEFNRKKLENELRSLLEVNSSDTEFHKNETNVPKNGTEPAIIQTIKKSRSDLYARANYLHAQLSLVDDQTRKEYAFELLEIWDEIDTGWKIEDDFHKNGTVPDDKPKVQIAEAPIELMRQLNNCKSNISKAKAKLKKAIASGKESEINLKQSMLNHHLQIKEEIENKINQFNA